MLTSTIVLCFFSPPTSTPFIYTLSLHDALPIFLRDPHQRDAGGATPDLPDRARCGLEAEPGDARGRARERHQVRPQDRSEDRKSTRLNSSHQIISYAVFCLKKKKKKYYELLHII